MAADLQTIGSTRPMSCARLSETESWALLGHIDLGSVPKLTYRVESNREAEHGYSFLSPTFLPVSSLA